MIADALSALTAQADPARAAAALAYHKAPRRYLGVPVPVIEALVADWRASLDIDGRVALAADLWDSNIHEARVAAAKLLTQARIRPDDAVWTLTASWVPDFDGWALADHACDAIRRRLLADPSRVAVLEGWTTDPHMWTRRAALVATLPWARMNHPKPADISVRETALRWAASLADDRDWFIQKAVAWWLRDLSKHDPARTRAFLAEHGHRLKPFARTEAARHLAPD